MDSGLVSIREAWYPLDDVVRAVEFSEFLDPEAHEHPCTRYQFGISVVYEQTWAAQAERELAWRL